MNRAIYLGLCFAFLAPGSSSALAHTGEHSSFGWMSLAMHLIEPDHLVFIAMIVLVGILAFRRGRRAERRIRDRGKP